MRINAEHTLADVLADHKLWLEDSCKGSRADLSGANLSKADLSRANLSKADLSYTNLSGTIYEKDIPIIINTEYYNIVKTKKYIKIGCEQHTAQEWAKFTKKQIQKMDRDKAAKFWKKYKKLVLLKV